MTNDEDFINDVSSAWGQVESARKEMIEKAKGHKMDEPRFKPTDVCRSTKDGMLCLVRAFHKEGRNAFGSPTHYYLEGLENNDRARYEVPIAEFDAEYELVPERCPSAWTDLHLADELNNWHEDCVAVNEEIEGLKERCPYEQAWDDDIRQEFEELNSERDDFREFVWYLQKELNKRMGRMELV